MHAMLLLITLDVCVLVEVLDVSLEGRNTLVVVVSCRQIILLLILTSYSHRSEHWK